MVQELAALAQLGADAIDRLAITPAQTMHAGIARRVFTHAGPTAAPTRVVHDRVAAAAYGVSRRAVLGAGDAIATGLRAAGGDVRPLSRSRTGRFLIGALNGITGDRLAERGNELAVAMSVRRDGEDVACSRPGLAAAFPAATQRVAVFLHGLAGTDEWWERTPRDDQGGAVRHAATRLGDATGCTPVFVRYNSGLHVSENGAHLSALLEELCAAWPAPLDDLVLIGHSMGGLVIRSAGQAAADAGHTWPSRTRHVVTLGTPHHGAPLAKAVHAAARLLRALPETEAIAGVLDMRSAGIRDLRFGALHGDDWRDEASAGSGDRRRVVPLLPGCRHTFITATLTPAADHPLGFLLGDLLVRTESAGGRHRERLIPVDPESVIHVGGLHHIDLLSHPGVEGILRDLLCDDLGSVAGRSGR